MLITALLVASVVLFYILIQVYIAQLAKAAPKSGEDIYYIDGEETFASVMQWIDRVEKYTQRDLSAQRHTLLYFKHNADETGRDYDYYSDYIDPIIKYLAINSENLFQGSWRLCDRFAKVLVLYLLVLYAASAGWLVYMLRTDLDPGEKFILTVVYLFASVAAVRVLYAWLLLLLQNAETRFREKRHPLGAINKAILALQGVLAGLNGARTVGAMVEHTGYDITGTGGNINGIGGTEATIPGAWKNKVWKGPAHPGLPPKNKKS
jgi:hypothetical protein